MPTVPNVTLNDGNLIPQLGYGLYKTPPEITEEVVTIALDTGYRHIDTATYYQNESGVGKAARKSGIPRDELFITTKLWNKDQGYDTALRAFDKSLDELQMDYVDLYLIHWPCPALDRFVDTWKALVHLKEEGRAKSIGVSNFREVDIERIINATGVVPAVNQVESHPRLQQLDLRHFNQQHGITTEAWAPLAKGGELLGNDIILSLAKKHHKTPAQVILRWHLDLNTVVFPKSVTPARIEENFDVLDFTLDEEDMTAIATLDNNTRLGSDPSTTNRFD